MTRKTLSPAELQPHGDAILRGLVDYADITGLVPGELACAVAVALRGMLAEVPPQHRDSTLHALTEIMRPGGAYAATTAPPAAPLQ